MKTNHILIALAIIAALSMVSCKNNNKKAQSQEPTQEEVQEMKQALADSVLAEIDRISEKYIAASVTGFRVRGFELTDEEKLIKPDYLLEPSRVNDFVTRPQKINAMAIYFVDLGIRQIFDMPQDDVREAIAKLATELNHPIDMDFWLSNAPTSEKVRREYDAFKEKGDLAYFWQFQYAIILEYDYLLVQNPDLFFSKISEEQFQSFYQKRLAMFKAIEELAKYDKEMARLWDFRNKNRVTASDEERDHKHQSISSAKQYSVDHKDQYIAKRNALLQ